MKKKIFGILVCMLMIISMYTVAGYSVNIHTNEDKNYPINEDDTWMKTFGGKKIDAGSSVLQVSDGYVVVGATKSYGSGEHDVWLIKTNNNGEEIWRILYGTKNDDFGNDVKQTDDGGFILTGYTERSETGKDVWLLKTDNNGELLWEKTFGNDNHDHGSEVVQTSDEGYIIVGNADHTGGPHGDVWLIKTDSNGNKLWDKKFGGVGHNHGSSVLQTLDGGYIIIGSSFVNQETESYDLWIIKTDNNGEMLWDKKYHNASADFGCSIEETTDGNYIIVGVTESGAGYDKVWLIKIDNEGDILWDETYGETSQDRAYSVQQTTDGGYILAGDCNKGNGMDAMLIKTDENGQEQWVKTYGGRGNDITVSVQQTTDGGYVLTGYETSRLEPDLWIIKTDPDGNAPTNKVKNQVYLRIFELFPNLLKILEFFRNITQ